MQHIVVCAATSGIMQALLRRWALQSVERHICLVGRDAERLHHLQADLQVRNPNNLYEIHIADLNDVTQFAQFLDAQPQIDLICLAQGVLPEQQHCEQDARAAHAAFENNAVAPALCALQCAEYFQRQGYGHLVLLGSVAGDRGRQSNYVYGAAKAMLDRLCEGLQHRFANSRIYITFIKPGPTDTAMTAHLKITGMKLASAELVAADIDRAIIRKAWFCYTPHHWRWIMLILRHLPRRIFHRLKI